MQHHDKAESRDKKLESRIMECESGVIKSFTDIKAWQEGHKLVLLVYSSTKQFPKEELFGLVNQMRRCAVSVTSNIAEGFGRKTLKDKIQFYSIALGSLYELQNQLLIAKDVNYINLSKFKQIADQAVIANKILNGLIKKSKSLDS